MSPLARQLRWLIGIRLLVITSIVVPYGLAQLVTPPPAVEPAAPVTVDGREAAEPAAGAAEPRTVPTVMSWSAFLRLAGYTYLASLLYIALYLAVPRRPVVQAYVQFLGDLLLVTALVYSTGGLASPFSIFYLVVIAVASTLLRREAGFTVATGAYLLYAGVLIGLHRGWLPLAASAASEPGTLARLTYHLVVSFVGFYLVAFLTYYLAHQFARTAAELQARREDLADLQVVHRDVIQSINTGLITTDLEGTVTSVNRAGAEILGLPEAELLGCAIDATPLFPGGRWSELLAGPGARQRVEAEVERPDGAVYVGYSLSPLSDADGTRRGHILIFQDLTRWRRLQEEVRLKDRMAAVGELAAGIAHEIGNPLAAISGSAQMLARNLGGDSSERKLVEILIRESQRLDRTIKGFLRFARPRERAVRRFDVAALLAETFELLRNSEEVAAGHSLDLRLDPPSAAIHADPDQVTQIFWNLARNALKAMPGGGTLEVVGELDGDTYRIRFTDDGRGMGAEERANLFHPFKSFFDTGSGIGMAIVYRIVQEHGGRLRVDSRPGAGTTIEVELPRGGADPPRMRDVDRAEAAPEAPEAGAPATAVPDSSTAEEAAR
jgi:two-component system sensor histidine kinase PilS (NtrC family)